MKPQEQQGSLFGAEKWRESPRPVLLHLRHTGVLLHSRQVRQTHFCSRAADAIGDMQVASRSESGSVGAGGQRRGQTTLSCSPDCPSGLWLPGRGFTKSSENPDFNVKALISHWQVSPRQFKSWWEFN